MGTFLKIVGIVLLISLWNYPAHEGEPHYVSRLHLPSVVECDSPKATLAFWDAPDSVCGECFSLDKSSSYLSFSLSRSSFCDETLRTWASVGPETRRVVSAGRPRVSPGLSPGTWIQVPIWDEWFLVASNGCSNSVLTIQFLIFPVSPQSACPCDPFWPRDLSESQLVMASGRASAIRAKEQTWMVLPSYRLPALNAHSTQL